MFVQPTVSEITARRASFIGITLIILILARFGLATPFIAILFGYIVLMYLGTVMRKGSAVLIFGLLVLATFYLFIHFLEQAQAAWPLVRERSVPIVVEFALNHGLDLPFSDSESFEKFLHGGLREQSLEIAKAGFLTTRELVYVIISLVVACGIFLNGRADMQSASYEVQNNLYTAFVDGLSERFINFFKSFHTVMGAQIVISAVNTFFTGAFVVTLWILGTPLPYSFVIVVITFLCGILPIVGNLISNTVIFGIGLTQSPKLAIAALVFLIVLHKFEYFLNSKIIGGRIKNPMWLTLVGLLVGERLLGIPGMILAPVILHYVKNEASKVAVG